MKKLISIVLIMLLALSVTACNLSKDTLNPTNTENVSTAVETKSEETITKETEDEDIETEDTDEDDDTDTISEPIQDENWKYLYIDYLNALNHDNYSGYQLVYIDDDDKPELVIKSSSHIVPCYLCWEYNGDLYTTQISFQDFYYFEKENRFLVEEGFTGSVSHNIQSLNGDEVLTLESGQMCVVTEPQSYIWNGVELSAVEYENAKNSAFDTNTAEIANDLSSYSQICAQIDNY